MGFHREKVVKTRKKHQCWGCGKTYPEGSEMKSVTGTNDNEDAIGTWYFCMPCDDYMTNKADEADREYWNDYGIGLGDVELCRQERLR